MLNDVGVGHIKSILRAQVAHDGETLTETRPTSRLGWHGLEGQVAKGGGHGLGAWQGWQRGPTGFHPEAFG